MDPGSAKTLEIHDFIGDFLNNIRPGHKHAGCLIHHADEIRNCRGINRPSSAGAHNQGQLGNHATGLSITPENLGISAQRIDSFLNPGTSGIVDSHNRSPDIKGHIHDFADLAGMSQRQRTSEYSEILRKSKNPPSIHQPGPGNDTISHNRFLLHTELRAGVSHKAIGFMESAGIKKQLHSFPSCQEALGLAFGNSGFSATQECLPIFFFQYAYFFLHAFTL